MAGLRAKIEKLHSGAISNITSKIKVIKGDDVLLQKKSGNNKKKVIEIVVRL